METKDFVKSNSTKLKITLIHPPVLQFYSSLSTFGAVPPIGLAYIAAVLRKAGHDVSVIDATGEATNCFREIESPIGTLHMNGLNPEEIIERIDPRTEVIGITHMFLHEWPTVKEIAEKIKEKLPGAVVVLGGENATAFYDRIFEETKAVDYCVLGEGESTVVDLCERIAQGVPINRLQGLMNRAWADKENDGIEQPSERIRTVNDIPWPAWELFPIEGYLAMADRHGVNRGRSMPILATRGCPFQCTFCSSPQMWTTRYSTREPKAVVDEMKFYVERYRIDNFNFCDLTAIIKKEWIVEFCQLLMKEKLDITWQLPTGTRSEALDEEVLRSIYKTGCRNITYAPESGSERMLDIIKKRVKIPRMLDSLRAAVRAGLVTRINMIIGHPQERRPDIWKCLVFLIKSALAGCQDASVMIFSPYPGSEDTRNLIREGKIVVDGGYYYLALARSGLSAKTYNRIMSTGELVLFQYLLMVVFYSIVYLSRPWRILAMFKSMFTGQEQTNVDTLLHTKIQRSFRALSGSNANPKTSSYVTSNFSTSAHSDDTA